MGLLQTTTLSNQNIATALLAGTYTADMERTAVQCVILADQIAGNGLYTVYTTRQINGAGSAYEFQSRASVLVESGVTAITLSSLFVPLKSGDVLKVYIVGLAGDTTTPDITCEFWDQGFLKPTTADRTLDVTATGAAGVDWGNVENPTTTLGLSGTTIKDVNDVSLYQSVFIAKTADLAIVDTVVDAIKVKTDNLPTDPADESSLQAAIATRSSHSAADVWAVGSRTLTSFGTLVADIWASLTSGHVTVGSIGKLIVDYLDAAISSRMATFSYTAPDNASITAIKAKTDNLPTDPADQSAVEAAITAATSPLATAASITTLRGVDNDTLKTLSDQIDTIPGAAAGSITYPITITDGVNPLDGVDVWVSTDSAGSNVIARGYTNALGLVTFYLDAGTYYVWKTLAGYTFTNPSTEVVA